jgi:hypothetical protein
MHRRRLLQALGFGAVAAPVVAKAVEPEAPLCNCEDLCRVITPEYNSIEVHDANGELLWAVSKNGDMWVRGSIRAISEKAKP